MRLPLFGIITLITLAIAVDWYILRAITKRMKSPSTARKIHLICSGLLNAMLILAICLPRKSGSDDTLHAIMWMLFAYLSVYIPKYLWVLFDLLASLPRLWHGRRWRPLSMAGGVVGVVTFVAMWWGALVNRYDIDVNRVDIYAEDLPESFEGFTIAQISDLHVGTFGHDTTFISTLVDSVNALRPDVIFFTGDIVNRRSEELLPFMSTLSRLSAPAGVYSIMGNHDYGDYSVWPSEQAKEADIAALGSMQRHMGWNLLLNRHDFIRVGGDSIAVVGVENVGDPPFRTYGSLPAAYPAVGDSVFKILLSHNPAHWVNDIRNAPDKRIALTLSGHTHAMQMELGGISPAALRYTTWGGLYADPDSLRQLYVNIGAGTVGLPMRIGADPEITLLTLHKKQ